MNTEMNNDQVTNTGIQTCKQDRTSRESYFIHYNFQNTAALAGSKVKWSKTLPKPSTHIQSFVREGPLPHPRLCGCCRRGQGWVHLGFGFAGQLHLLCALFRVCLLILWQTSSSPCLSLRSQFTNPPLFTFFSNYRAKYVSCFEFLHLQFPSPTILFILICVAGSFPSFWSHLRYHLLRETSLFSLSRCPLYPSHSW